MKEEPQYRIQAVAEMTGVPAGTLRAWERRYEVPSPQRSGNRYRLYSPADVEAVRALAQMCAEGMAPSEAAHIVRRRMERGDPPLEAARAPEPARPVELPDDAWQAVLDQVVDAAVRLDPEGLRVAVQRALTVGSAYEVYQRVFAPALRILGEKWMRGDSGVSEEHFASHAIGGALQTMASLVQPPNPRHRLLLGCVASEMHDLPLLGVSVLAAHEGWGAVMLGARVPPGPLGEAVRKLRPSAIGLSVTVEVVDPDPGALFRAYGEACGATPWLVGGAYAAAYEPAIRAAGGQLARTSADLVPFLRRVDGGKPLAR